MKKITKEEITLLLTEEEADYFDFKEIHHENTAKLVHDVLSLSNSGCSSDRFIIFGVIDKSREVKGVKGKRKSQADIIDCLRSSNINRLPSLLLYEVACNNVILDVLHIKNEKYKPYFLLKDKKVDQVTVRAGVVYSRDNDTNTPINSTSSINQLETMWREKFGLDESPMERVIEYIKEIPNWTKIKENEAYYSLFPEFRIVWESENLTDDFHEHWINKKHTCRLANVTVRIFYHSTQLLEHFIINLEHKAFFPIPQYYDPQNIHDNGSAYIKKAQMECYICAIIDDIKSLDRYDTEFIKIASLKNPLDVYIHYLNIELGKFRLNISIKNEHQLSVVLSVPKDT